ncbi:hypothetical protein PT974_12330 [Cladobotryum mycophilum]|uniref:Geranylgeranyl pyrophosphate synthetase n=1 Tax=Cladobotryum mycophilum TaxID=491253 RepID=A0ABR0S8T7_9HYPO
MSSLFQQSGGVPRASIPKKGARSCFDDNRRPPRKSDAVMEDPPYGDLIKTITKDDLTNDVPGPYCGITGTELVSSYNWIYQLYPKIMVPGKPRLWTPLEEPEKLDQDRGTYYRDKNAAAYNEHPMEAALVSVMKMHPEPTDLGVDIVACGSTIGNLLRFIRGEEKPFRMLVEFIGNTVHLIRREKSPLATIPGVRGYGHTFPEKYTSWGTDVGDSRSHQRILNYQFGGLNLMLRFEGDGYIKLEEKTPTKSPTRIKKEDSDVLEGFKNLILQVKPVSIVAGRLEVLDGGGIVPQDAIFDLKTRSVHGKDRDTLAEEMPRLWVSQIHKFILAYHKGGLFDEMQIKDVWDDVQTWEKDNQPALRSLAKLLQRLVDERLKVDKDVKIEIVRQEGGPLKIRKRLPDAGTPFSKEVYQQWAKWLEGHSGADVPGEFRQRGDES